MDSFTLIAFPSSYISAKPSAFLPLKDHLCFFLGLSLGVGPPDTGPFQPASRTPFCQWPNLALAWAGSLLKPTAIRQK